MFGLVLDRTVGGEERRGEKTWSQSAAHKAMTLILTSFQIPVKNISYLI